MLIKLFATKKDGNMQTVCPTCGSKFDYDVQFCDKCGANLEKKRLINEQKKENVNSTAKSLNTNYQGYLQIISALEIAFGIFGVVSGLLIALIAPFLKDIITSSPNQTVIYTSGMYQFFTVLLLFIGVLVLIVSGCAIYFGYKLYRLENSGRFGTMILSCFALLAFPFGTVFGIISLILLNRPETIQLLQTKKV